MDEELKIYLEKQGIKYSIHEHPATFTVAQSKEIKKIIPGRHTKCLFMKDENHNFYLIAIPAEKMLDKNALKKSLSIKQLVFASPKELNEELNLAPGSVSIFGMIHASKTMLIIDNELWAAPIVTFHPNINIETLELSHESFEKFYNSLASKKEVIEL